MTRRLVIVTSTFLLGAAALGAMAATANDGRGRAVEAVAPGGEVQVPLPVSRPAWIERAATTAPRGGKPPSQLLVESGASGSGTAVAAASESGSSGLKSGSAEALAVQLEGTKVLSSEGNVVGEVKKVIEEQGGGRQAVVSVGGFLGIGESRVLMPTETLTPSGKGMVRTELTEQQIKSLPAYEM